MQNGDTALTCALRYNQQSVVNQLFTYKNLDVNIVDEHGDNVLLIASMICDITAMLGAL